MKVNSAIFIASEFLLGANPYAGLLWRIGCGCAIFGHGVSIRYGKGGDRVESSAFRFSLKDTALTVGRTIALPFRLLTKTYWQQAARDLKTQGKSGLVRRAWQALDFRRYPMETCWFCFGTAGACYLTDALMSGPVSRRGDAVIGGLILAGSATGFLTNNPKLAGSLYSLTTCFSFGVGIATRNWALIDASFAFLLANYTFSRTDPERQSAHTIRQAESVPALSK